MADHDKNKTYLCEIWEFFDSINDKFLKNGIIIDEIVNDSYFFNITFDNSKLPLDSLAKKHNITGIRISCKWKDSITFSPNITLLNNNHVINNFNEDGLTTIISISSQFTVLDFLKKIFKIAGIEFNDIKKINIIPEDVTIDDMNIYKNVSIQKIKEIKDIKLKLEKYKKDFSELLKEEEILYKKISDLRGEDNVIFLKNIYAVKIETLKKLECIFNKSERELDMKEKNNIITFNFFLKSINGVLENHEQVESLYNIQLMKQKIKELLFTDTQCVYNINKSNILFNETFILETIKFEKKMFLEIFKCETLKQEIPENIIIKNTLFIKISNEIKEYLDKFVEFENLEYEMGYYLEYIYKNCY